MEIDYGNIEKLIKNFDESVDRFYSRKNSFPESALHFHRKTIGERRKAGLKQLLKDSGFSELLYATLVSWGMDRMDASARLVSFEDFYRNLADNSDLLHEIEYFKLDDGNADGLERNLSVLFKSVKVMKGGAKLVGTSKTLHHLLPDLVMPMDRKYTLRFFYSSEAYTENDQEKKFLEIFGRARYIHENLKYVKAKLDLKREWDTSIPKMIDNAIIGFLS